jgi:hypothetical protein
MLLRMNFGIASTSFGFHSRHDLRLKGRSRKLKQSALEASRDDPGMFVSAWRWGSPPKNRSLIPGLERPLRIPRYPIQTCNSLQARVNLGELNVVDGYYVCRLYVLTIAWCCVVSMNPLKLALGAPLGGS